MVGVNQSHLVAYKLASCYFVTVRKRFENWEVLGFQRDRLDASGYVIGREDVVVIVEPDAYRWEVVVEEDKVIDFRAQALGREPVDFATMPYDNLVRTAKSFHRRVGRNYDDTGDHRDAVLVSHLQPGQPRTLDGSPTPEEFARVWLATGKYALDGRPRRQALAELWEVTPYAVDKWARRARDLGLIPRADTGAPRGARKEK